MSSKNFNVVRELRLQLKTGFRKKAPPEYDFMRRYPPITKPAKQQAISRRRVPYMDLYNKAKVKYGAHGLEAVYPAYWQQTPLALVLAKKQYEFMQTGVNEDEAFTKAREYVNELEDKAYLELKSLKESLKEMGANTPFMIDSEVQLEIDYWREIMKDTAYEDLDLADQGDVDQLILKKVLNWKQVEMERRMKDPLFVTDFEDLRNEIFPMAKHIEKQKTQKLKNDFKDMFFKLMEIDPTKIKPRHPFYAEDYLNYFQKTKEEPELKNWGNKERKEFSQWVIDTLAPQDIFDKNDLATIQHFLSSLRAQFFPAIRYPEKTDNIEVPTVDQLRAVLYKNGVGYKKVDNKMFVGRFYRIPYLLFPKETLMEKLITEETNLQGMLEDDNALLTEIKNSGLDTASLPGIQEELREYSRRLNLDAPNYGSSQGSDVDMSVLDTILEEKLSQDDMYDDDLAAEQDETLDDDDVDNTDELVPHDDDVWYVKKSKVSAEEWQKVVEKYFPPSKTALERDRDQFYSVEEQNSVQEADSELELIGLQRDRLEREIRLGAELELQFEKRQAAKRKRDFEQRNPYSSEHVPLPSNMRGL